MRARLLLCARDHTDSCATKQKFYAAMPEGLKLNQAKRLNRLKHFIIRTNINKIEWFYIDKSCEVTEETIL